MVYPEAIILTIIFSFFTSLLFGFYMGIPIGIYSIYQILFGDEKHKWNGKEWVNETKNKENGNIQ